MEKIAKKRRRQNKTDYKARLSLLKADAVRIVVRRTNKYIVIQAVESVEAQDKVIFGLTSKALLEKGWDKKNVGSLKSIPAAYLTGLLAAKSLDKKKKYILDLGMARNIAGSRLYSALKGLIDGGVPLNANKKAFPSEDRISGKHVKKEEMINKIKSKL